MSNEFLSVEQAAALLTVSPWTIRSWLTSHRLRRYHAGRRVVLRREDVLGMVTLETKSEQAARNSVLEERTAKAKK
jgi:excisionase family DNA binding protein